MGQQQRTDGKTLSAWLTQELDGYHFHDARLTRRFHELAAQLWDNLGQSIPLACQDWANKLFCLAHQLGTHFLARTCVDRLAGDGGHTIADEMEEVRVKGKHRVEVRDRRGNVATAVVELRFKRVHVLPPIGKQARYPELTLTVLHARESGKPKGRDPIDWKLLTDLPVTTRAQAIEKLHWYALRWKIETFHKILKSGCKVEQSKLRTADRLVNLIAVYCILAWRIFWMTMMQRAAADKAAAAIAFTATEQALPDRLVRHVPARGMPTAGLSYYLLKLACLGGYLARSRDPPPGNIVIWRGLTRLSDMELGYVAALGDVGN